LAPAEIRIAARGARPVRHDCPVVARFYGDLHIHSRYSRACSRDCDLEHLAWWAGRKGIGVVGTGDFTHPAWTAELKENLRPAEPGLFRLEPSLERAVQDRLPAACRLPARFLLSVEISTIYKRDGRTRKVHHLLYAPSLEVSGAITASLAKIGNLAADGRPILGLDSRDLLEITLEAGGYLIPAHAWTPWFAVLGSQSGFDRVADCYADLAGHIFAIETGLSSDPAMNWRVSSLDGYRLVSNSDAHSPPMLGREATAFSCDLSYDAIRAALETGDGFAGSVEFFPEEGKYHLDGHRACDVRTTPQETRAAGGKCPACGKQPTIGVQHRVDVLADRPEGYVLPGAAGFKSFVQLPEIIGEIAGVGPKSKTVAAQVAAMVERFGPELSILGDVPLDELAARAPATVAEAIARLRRGEVRRDAGYDGVYGTIRLFDPGELASRSSGMLFDLPKKAPGKKQAASSPAGPASPGGAGSAALPGARQAAGSAPGAPAPAASGVPGLDPEQAAVVTAGRGPLLVVAGPGAGKTRVLTHMIAHRIRELGVPAERCLAVTFTRRAAAELTERLAADLRPDIAGRVTVATFHGLGLIIIREQLGGDWQVTDENLDELVSLPVAMLGADEALAGSYRQRWTDVFVDEYQDVDETQYRLLRLLTGDAAPVAAIGDPDQSIYGFRGGDVGYFLRFRSDYENTREVRLERSYRSAPTIVTAAMQLIRPGTLAPGRRLIPARTDIPDGPVVLRRCADERDEAELVAATIEKMLGGTTLTAFDSGEVDSRHRAEHQLSFSDFAVLHRTSAQGGPVAEALERRGFPVQQRSHTRLSAMAGVPQILSSLSGQLFGPGPRPAGPATDDDGFRDTVSGRVRAATEMAVSVGGPDLASVIRGAAEALAPLAARCGDDMTRFLGELSMGAEVDTWDPRADRISMLTLHASKGLEFPVVFIVGCDDGLLPLRPWKGAEIDYAEERRLLFVGMTRATTRLVLTGADKRVTRGEVRESPPSPFLSSVSAALLDTGDDAKSARRRRRPPAQQLTLL
jgi:DNA helicase II / ATP-dependent DNA helicase PcrA